MNPAPTILDWILSNSSWRPVEITGELPEIRFF